MLYEMIVKWKIGILREICDDMNCQKWAFIMMASKIKVSWKAEKRWVICNPVY